MDLSRITGHRVSFTVDLEDGGEHLSCSYVRNTIPLDYYKKLDEFYKSDDESIVTPIEHQIETLMAAKLGWDITDNGVKVEATADRLREWVPLTTAVYRALEENLRPKPKSSPTSEAGS
ncbi:hypothetical protein EON81_04265 [bacterium]|nr:MAG: hypothetical protein EON81_04265 [bacterium]